MPTLVERAQELEIKRGELKKLFDDHRSDAGYTFAAEQLDEVNRRNDELSELQKAYEGAKGVADIEAQNERRLAEFKTANRTVPFAAPERGSESRPHPDGVKSIGDRFTASAAYKQFAGGGRHQFAVEMDDVTGFKTTFTTTAATLTGYDRQPGIVTLGTQRLMVADLLAQGQTTMNTIRYVQEDTLTNAATTVTEGALKPEATFDTSEADAPVRKIAVTAKVTDEMFSDFPVIRDYIDNRLRWMVGQREELQILAGTGTPPDITGILVTSGILTQARGTDPVPDAVFKAMTKIMTTGFFDPDGIVMNTTDWQNVRLLKTADGIYLWGAPADEGPARMWGLPVVATTAMTLGTALVGAFRLGAQLFRREGVTVESTNANEDDFKRNLIALRAEERIALAVYRPKAFSTVTGLP